MEKLTARLEKIIYQSDTGVVKIGLFRFADFSKIVTGDTLPDSFNCSYELEGEWIQHPKYGKQFKCTSYSVTIPSSITGIRRFLSSRLISGIGKITAERIVDKFGEDSIRTIEETPEKLLEIKGITKNKLEKIVSSYRENVSNCQATIRLMQSGFTEGETSKIISTYAGKTIDVLENEPYKFSRIKGISFKKADALGNKTDEYINNEGRFSYAAFFVLKENEYGNYNTAQGSLYMEYQDLCREMAAVLGYTANTDVWNNNFKAAVQKGKLKCFSAGDKTYVITAGLYDIETELAKRISNLASKKYNITKFKIEDLKALEEKRKINLNEFQEEAVMTALTNGLMLLIGAPGTGKTTTIQFIADICKEYDKNIENVILLAPTGKAAKRITECSNLPASTIHSFLRIGREEIEKADDGNVDPIENTLIIVDECSMLDERIAYRLFDSVGKNSKVVLCGDDAQLQSVGAGAVLRDIQNSGSVKTVRLETVYRQQKGGDIFYNIDNIRHGKTDMATGGDFVFTELSDMDSVEELMAKAYYAKVKEYGVENVMMLAPFKNHSAGVNNLNKIAQEMLNPLRSGQIEYNMCEKRFRVGDYVINLTNTDELVNGDVGFVTLVDVDDDGKKTVTAQFGNTERVYDSRDINDLSLAYAMTVHKAQGSEARCVITCMNSMHSVMLKRNVIYTALSRAREQVYLIGEKSAFDRAVKTKDTDTRVTFLRNMIAGMCRAQMS